MVVCKYFLQGTCKFGSNCKFEHQLNDRTNGQSILRQNALPTGSGSNNNPADVNTLVRSVQTDMNNTEHGGQWLLSSYAPFKEKPAFPGFEDKSFEEIRMGYYEAMKNGTAEQYKQQLQALLQEAVMKVRALQNPSGQIVNLLKEIYNSPVAINSTFANSQSVFGGAQNSNAFNKPPTNSVFGGQTTSPFGGQAPSAFAGQTISAFAGQSPSAFSGQTSPFASQNNQNFSGQGLFSNPQVNSPAFGNNQNIFGGHTSSATSIFGGTQTQAAIPADSTSPFNKSTPTSQTSIFAQNNAQNSPFAVANAQGTTYGGQTTQTIAFGVQATQSGAFLGQQGAFAGQTTQSGAFGAQTTQSGAFGAQTTPGGVFGAQTTPSGAFGGQGGSFGGQTTQSGSQATPFSNQGTNFGQSPLAIQQGQTNSIFGGGQNAFTTGASADKNEDFYSKPEDLTQEEIQAFQSDSFQFGKIPDKPPPIQFCF